MIRQLRLDVRIVGTDEAFGFPQGQIDSAHDFPQKAFVPFGGRHDALPVPLVHKDGMNIVGFLVAADGVHVGIQSFSHGKSVGFEGLTLPFGQGVNDFSGLAGFLDVEGDGTLHPVQIIVETGLGGDHDGGRNTGQVQRFGQFRFKKVLDQFDGDFRVPQIQYGIVILRYDQVHDGSLLKKTTAMIPPNFETGKIFLCSVRQKRTGKVSFGS